MKEFFFEDMIISYKRLFRYYILLIFDLGRNNYFNEDSNNGCNTLYDSIS